jgi:pyocin large subunit-like protein
MTLDEIKQVATNVISEYKIDSLDDIFQLKDKLSLDKFLDIVRVKAVLLKVVSKYKWGNASTFIDHYTRHGSDFGNITQLDYAELANSFYKKGDVDSYLKKVDSS